MDPTTDDRITALQEQETRLVLGSFDHADAWRLGAQMVEKALREIAPVIVDIRRRDLVLFHSAQAGTTAENEVWLKRKARTVFRFETSTALLQGRFAARGIDQWTTGWFDARKFTATGGSFPVRVHGAGVIAAVTVSGLTSDADHDFVVNSLTAYVRQQAPPS